MTENRFKLNHSSLTGEYNINDNRNEIVFPTTTSKPQAIHCIEFLNNQENKIHYLHNKAASWKITAGEQLHDASRAESKLEIIEAKVNKKITELEKLLDDGVKKGYPTGIINSELDIYYELKEDLL